MKLQKSPPPSTHHNQEKHTQIDLSIKIKSITFYNAERILPLHERRDETRVQRSGEENYQGKSERKERKLFFIHSSFLLSRFIKITLLRMKGNIKGKVFFSLFRLIIRIFSAAPFVTYTLHSFRLHSFHQPASISFPGEKKESWDRRRLKRLRKELHQKIKDNENEKNQFPKWMNGCCDDVDVGEEKAISSQSFPSNMTKIQTRWGEGRDDWYKGC